MQIKVDLSGLQQTQWHEYAIRFFFGGLITAIAGIIAKECGAVVGGLFLAFPAIFPASATLIEKHLLQGLFPAHHGFCRASLALHTSANALQRVLNPARPGQPAVERFGWRFQIGDKVIQTENDYDKDVFNGDVGIVERIDAVEQQVAVRFDERLVKYDFGELDEISLAYAITIHKSQGSEFPAVVIPLATQHYMLLQRNLIYTGITRGKRLLVLIGQKKALGIAVRNDRPQRRYSGLLISLRRDGQSSLA